MRRSRTRGGSGGWDLLLAMTLVAVGGTEAAGAAGGPPSEPLVGDRPDFTESAVVVPEGSVQVESGLTSARLVGARAESYGELLCRIGLSDLVELRLEPGSYLRQRGDGTAREGRDDSAVGCKVSLGRARGRWPEAALIAGTTLPTGAAALSSDRLQPDILLALGWKLGPSLALGANAGCGWLHNGSGSFTEGRASASLGASLTPRVGAFLEAYAWTAAPGEGQDPAYADLGVTALVSDRLQFDLRYGSGFNGRDPDRYWGAGFVARR